MRPQQRIYEFLYLLDIITEKVDNVPFSGDQYPIKAKPT